MNRQDQDSKAHLALPMIDRDENANSSMDDGALLTNRTSHRVPLGMVTESPDSVKIVHKAHYIPSCWVKWCPQWDYHPERKYLYVLENGYEFNEPFLVPTFLKFFSLNWFCCCNLDGMILCCFKMGVCGWVPPNTCCTSNDAITKVYFDRGVFDQQFICFRGIGGGDPIFGGMPTVYSGPTQYVCCCIDCPQIANEAFECSIPWLCGEKISARSCSNIRTFELNANCCCNCCGLCGIKNGQPLCVNSMPGGSCLLRGEGAKLADAMNIAYLNWYQLAHRHPRTSKA